ncbi:MAG: OsmC family protein [Polyangia bacterium]
MSTHETRLTWKLGNRAFRHQEYGRDHEVFLADKPLAVSAAAEYRGNPELTNPEDLLVAALSSCHMLSFLAIAARRGFTVQSYDDRAVGTLAKNDEGRLAITTCVLHPQIVFGGPIDRAQLDSLHDEAHHACFIASSVKTVVTIEPSA